MLGAIRKREILAHPLVTIQCFGWNVFIKALLAGPNQTFLALLMDTGRLVCGTPKVPQLVSRCVNLEQAAEQIYQNLANRFALRSDAGRFFRALAGQEKGHAELLVLCRAAAEREGWDEKHFAPWRSVIPNLEQQMDAARNSAAAVTDLHKALQLVIEIESSELDHVFDGIVAASDSDFVRRLEAFQHAGDRHIDFLCEQIVQLDPSLAEPCKAMRCAHLGERHC